MRLHCFEYKYTWCVLDWMALGFHASETELYAGLLMNEPSSFLQWLIKLGSLSSKHGMRRRYQNNLTNFTEQCHEHRAVQCCTSIGCSTFRSNIPAMKSWLVECTNFSFISNSAVIAMHVMFVSVPRALWLRLKLSYLFVILKTTVLLFDGSLCCFYIVLQIKFRISAKSLQDIFHWTKTCTIY